MKFPESTDKKVQKQGPSTDEKEGKENGAEGEKATKLHEDLVKICTMFGEKFKMPALNSCWSIASISETQISKALKENEDQIIEFHHRNLTRIYPKGTRVDSSNFVPIEAWMAGSQMSALNFQTYDEAMLLNYAKFLDNGCGYVLKPFYYRYSAKEEEITERKQYYPRNVTTAKKELSITVISGQQLRFAEKKNEEGEKQDNQTINPLVKVTLRGHPSDDGKSLSTKVMKGNAFNPVWNETFRSPIYYPDFLFVKFEVMSSGMLSDTQVAQYAIPFNCMRTGYRIVPLLSQKLIPIKYAYLFVHITITDVGVSPSPAFESARKVPQPESRQFQTPKVVVEDHE
jgi:hypothetical protein